MYQILTHDYREIGTVTIREKTVPVPESFPTYLDAIEFMTRYMPNGANVYAWRIVKKTEEDK